MSPKQISLILGSLAFLPLSLVAEETPAISGTTATPAPSPVVAAAPVVKPAAGKPVYRPPMMGAPSLRVGGGSRGGTGSDATLAALVPDHVGFTTKADPSLFWYQSKPANARLEITVVEPKKPKPLARMQAKNASRTGIQRINLSKFNIALQPGVSYKWSIALVTDAQKRSLDVVASGVITRIPESDALAAKLKTATPAERPFVYAEAGVWYDALESISDLIDSNPTEKEFRVQRAELLEQIGLPKGLEGPL